MAVPIMKFIFPGKYEGFEILKIFIYNNSIYNINSNNNINIQGVGNYIVPVINLFIGCIVKIILTLILVPMPEFNIYGAVIASIVAYIVATILNIILLKIKLKIRIEFI